MNKVRERVPTGRRGRPSKSMIAAALERPFCAYLHKICLNNRLEGHKYCIDHIMNDKTAPYRQCTYVHSVTGRRCTRAARKVDRRASPLCQIHKSYKLNFPSPPTVSPEETNLLQDLAHHSKLDSAVRSTNTFWIPKGDGSAIPSEKLGRAVARYFIQRQADDAPAEMPTMEEIAARHNNADSDTESVENDQDMFKHAQVFTEEEVTRTLRDKMIRLRRLYIEQYGHIQYILKEKRLKFIQAQRFEDEIHGELYSFRNHRDSPDYVKLSAMLRYHKTFGPDSLLEERRKLSRPQNIGARCCQSKTKTATSTSTKTAATTTSDTSTTDTTTASTTTTTTTTGTIDTATSTTTSALASTPTATIITTATATSTTATTTTCIFSKVQGCDKPCIPLSPYCRQHILYDEKQVLFRPCAGGSPPCLTPVVSFIRKNKCLLHTALNIT